MSTSSNKQQKKGKDGMGKAGKRKEMVKDWGGVSCVWKSKLCVVICCVCERCLCVCVCVCACRSCEKDREVKTVVWIKLYMRMYVCRYLCISRKPAFFHRT